MRWKSLDKNRKIKLTANGFHIVTPKKKSETIPLACPVCDCFLNGNIDISAYQRHMCCNFCESKYTYSALDNWLSGWRPDKKTISEDLKIRKMTHSFIIF